MKIGLLQTGRFPAEMLDQYGDYNHMFERFLAGRALDMVTYAVLDGVLPDDVNDADGWLISGSRVGVYEAYDWIPPLENFIREAYACAVPIAGICFGHQILAQALGGRVEKFPGGWSIGNKHYAFEGFPDGIRLLAWHQDQVIEAPADATVIGSSPFCKYAALRYGDKAFSIQAHPEFTADFLADLLELLGESLPPAIVMQASAELRIGTASREIADWIENFLKQNRLRNTTPSVQSQCSLSTGRDL